MSKHDYYMSLEIEYHDYPFYAIIMAAMRQADTKNLNKLSRAFPAIYDELKSRYHAPGGVLPEDTCRKPSETCSGAKLLTPTTI